MYTVDDVDAFGLLVAWHPLPRTYYFADISRIRDYDKISPDNAILIMEHHRLGFDRGNWNVVGTIPNFDASKWPKPTRLAGDDVGLRMAATKTVNEFGRFDHDVDWRNIGLTMDHQLFGIPFPAIMLRKILESGDVGAGRINFYANPKPDGGEWFKRYKQERGVS